MKKMMIIWVLLVAIFGVASSQSNDVPSFPGNIAYIGSDYNVYSATMGQGELTVSQLTVDADARRHYQLPTWSTDGRLAYFCCDPLFSGRTFTEVFITDDAMVSGKSVYSEQNEILTYANWSPANCQDGENCRDLAVLLGGNRDGFKVELIRETGSRTVGTGSPFYFSWSSDGNEMLWQRNNQRIDVFSVLEDEISRELGVTPGLFPAPMWSPVDDRLLMGILNRENFTTQLVTIEGEGETILVEGIQGLVAFNWSPDGEYVAYRILNQQGYGGLTVINAKTGEEVRASEGENVIAFFWSPDSTKIAYIIPDLRPNTFDTNLRRVQQDEFELEWLVLDMTTGDIQRYTNFFPTPDMVYLLSYFDQFAQSHRLWSADSRYLIYGERTGDDETSISILDTNDANTVPFSLAAGVIGIWSYQ